MDDLHINSYLSHYAFFVFAETNERCEVRHKFPTRAQFFRSGDNQLCWTHPGQLRRRVEAHHCEPTSTRWPHGYSIPFSSSSLTQRVIMLRRVFTSGLVSRWLLYGNHRGFSSYLVCAHRAAGSERTDQRQREPLGALEWGRHACHPVAKRRSGLSTRHNRRRP